MKKGFTLVELLFVMAIISILAGFAIAKLNDSTRVATINSMKLDLRNSLNSIEAARVAAGGSENQSYSGSCITYETQEFGRSTRAVKGLCNPMLISGGTFTKIALTDGNALAVNKVPCVAPVTGSGIKLIVRSKNLANIELYMDTCIDGSMYERAY